MATLSVWGHIISSPCMSFLQPPERYSLVFSTSSRWWLNCCTSARSAGNILFFQYACASMTKARMRHVSYFLILYYSIGMPDIAEHRKSFLQEVQCAIMESKHFTTLRWRGLFRLVLVQHHVTIGVGSDERGCECKSYSLGRAHFLYMSNSMKRCWIICITVSADHEGWQCSVTDKCRNNNAILWHISFLVRVRRWSRIKTICACAWETNKTRLDDKLVQL